MLLSESLSEVGKSQSYDFAVIGAGIAGASVAYELQSRGRTLLLEREPLPGHHTTGRSAAFYVESYGNRVVQLLTGAGRALLEDRTMGFAQHPLAHRSPMLWIARSASSPLGGELAEVSAAEARSMCPVLRDDQIAMGIVEERALHIDVAALLGAYLAGFRDRGGHLATRAGVTGLRVMRATTLEIRNVQHRWAGLRSFVADRAPVIGMDPEVSGLCWLAGQGGFGIMTSPSAARAAASLIVDGALPADLKALGITPEMLAPSRLALRSEVPGN